LIKSQVNIFEWLGDLVVEEDGSIEEMRSRIRESLLGRGRAEWNVIAEYGKIIVKLWSAGYEQHSIYSIISV
jgi:hypothetical protein